jgi:hypothetical protein
MRHSKYCVRIRFYYVCASNCDDYRTWEVWHVLKRISLSRRLMIWLLPHPPFRQQVVPLSQSSCVSQVKLTDRRGGWEGVGKEPNHTTARRPQ